MHEFWYSWANIVSRPFLKSIWKFWVLTAVPSFLIAFLVTGDMSIAIYLALGSFIGVNTIYIVLTSMLINKRREPWWDWEEYERRYGNG